MTVSTDAGPNAGLTAFGDERPTLAESVRELEPVIRAAERVMEDERRVPDEITDALYRNGMYRAFTPRELGGLEVDPVEWLEAIEELSRINGSVGWLGMLHTGNTFAAEPVMRRIMATERWIIAGNLGRAGGTARRVPGGYRITGRWPFASGSPEATYLFGRSVLVDELGAPVIHPVDGLPWFVTAYWPRSQTILHDTWDGLGLRATGSGDIEVRDIFVPGEMVNEMGLWSRRYDRPLYRGPFVLMAHAAHAIGLATAALAEFRAIANRDPAVGSTRQMRLGKEQVHQIAVARADALVRAARLLLHDSVARAYRSAHESEFIDYELRVLLHESNVHAVHSCQEAIQLLFAQVGTSGVFRGRALERIHRDMTTAAQHIIVGPASLDRVGQYWLTRDLPSGPQIDVEGGFIAGPHPQFAHRRRGADTAHG